jgi:hypothetical protein
MCNWNHEESELAKAAAHSAMNSERHAGVVAPPAVEWIIFTSKLIDFEQAAK